MYAATLNNPDDLSWLYGSSLVMDPGLDLTQYSEQWTLGFEPGISSYYSEGTLAFWSVALRALALDLLTDDMSGDVLDPAVDPLDGAQTVGAELLAVIGNDIEGSIFVSDVSGTGYTPELVVVHDAPPSELILVDTIESLRCAMTGFIEGVPCEWSDVQPIAGASPQSSDVPPASRRVQDRLPTWSSADTPLPRA